MMRSNYLLKIEQGMTLIELTVVLLILTTLATIALRSTTNLVEQARWEQTKKRYEEIKKAIIGDPDLIINDQPDISGFVADMGRLPNNIHELLDQNYCSNDYSVSTSSSCSGSWIQQNPSWVAATSTTIGYGWNGPYLSTSENSHDSDAFSDGWGALATDNNYGWNYILTDTSLPPTITPPLEILRFQSCGKNQTCSDADTDYDADYPVSPSPPATPPIIPVALEKEDWKVDISGGIEVSINSSGIGSCDTSSIANGNACKDAGWTWPGEFKCLDPITFIEITTGSPPVPTYTDYSACTTATPSNLWRWQPVAKDTCTNPAYTTKSTCEAGTPLPPATSIGWGECKNTSPASKSKAFCETYGALWKDSPDVCLRINYRTINTSTNATEITSNVDSAGETILTTSTRQTVLFDTFTNTAGSPPVVTAIPDLPAGNAMFGVYHFDNVTNSCSTLPYPANTCKGLDPATGQATCTGATPAGIWDAVNGFCYGINPPDCLGATPPGTPINSVENIPPVFKSIIPHKAIPQITW